MKPKHAAGLIYGPEAHHLDHVAVLCQVMQIPLIVSDDDLSQLARTYYPHLECLAYDYVQLTQAAVQNFDVLFCSFPRPLFEEIFFFAQQFLHKRVHSIWCPHGNSDKGHLAPFMEGLSQEEIALVYGKKMLDFLKAKGAMDQLRSYVILGNFRHVFYQKRKAFYDALALKEISQRLPTGKKKTLLYAPTWDDSENSSSFFAACQELIERLPNEYNLIIKPHPHLLRQLKTEQLLLKYEDLENVLFLTQFPPIYPLLNLVDVYIGDMSSIGYDFLTFDRPMFFLNQTGRNAAKDPGLFLYRCGVEIKPEHYAKIYETIHYHLESDKEDFSHIRKEVYNYTFGPEKSEEHLREEILKTYSLLPDPDLDFL